MNVIVAGSVAVRRHATAIDANRPSKKPKIAKESLDLDFKEPPLFEFIYE